MQKYYNKDDHDVADFLIRAILGIVFLYHGWAKIGDMAGTIQFFGSVGLPEFLAYVVAIIEFLGGIMMILGAWTKQVAWLFVAVMIGAIWFVKGSNGFVGGYEFDLTLLVASLAIAYLPTGKYTYKKLIGR